MARFTTFAAVVALGLGAGACGPTDERRSPPANNPQPLLGQPAGRAAHRFRARPRRPAATACPPSEQQRLDAWFALDRPRYGDRISIDEPRGYASRRARADVARVAGRYGLLLSDGAPVTATARSSRARSGSSSAAATRQRPGLPELGASTPIAADVNTSTNYRLRDQFQPRRDDRRSGRSGARPGRQRRRRSARPRPRRSSVYRDAQPTGTGSAARNVDQQEVTDDERALQRPRRRGASRSLRRLRLRRRDRRAAAAGRRRAWLGAGEGQQGRAAQRGPVAVGLGEPEHPVRRPVANPAIR